MVITDPRYADQWHFALLGDIETIWDEYSGAGVSVGVYDNGVDTDHPDLAANYDASLQYVLAGTDTATYWTGATHGTSVAGLIGAARNGSGGVGVAWGVSLTSVNYLDVLQNASEATLLDAVEQMARFDIVNQSYGATTDFNAAYDIGDTDSFDYAEAQAMLYAATWGRDGLGTIMVRAAGNDANDYEYQTNYGMYGNAQGDSQNNLHTLINVGAIGQNGFVASYSNYGHNLLISAPAASVTTTPGTTFNTGYTTTFDGTSAATPVVAGVVALMLEANPDLGYRDVQTILALSAAQTGSDFGGPAEGWEVDQWRTLGGETWNGGQMTFHENYGFGAVDAFAAVRMAEAWSLFENAELPATEWTMESVRAADAPYYTISDFGTVETTMTVDAGIVIEHVYVTIGFTHTWIGDLIIDLITPDGEVINLMYRDGGSTDAEDDWTFGVASLRGMSTDGDWTVRISDNEGGDTGMFYTVNLEFLGAYEDTDDTWTVTEDFLALQAVETARASFDDTNGGFDMLNAVALQGNVTVRLGETGVDGILAVDGVVWSTLTDGAIEGAATGDGNDRLTGSAGDNTLMAGRGSNIVTGMGGADVLIGLGSANVIIAEETGLYGLDESDQIYRLFNTIYGREPGEAGHQSYTAQLAAGLVTLEDLATTFITAPEFEVRYGTGTTNEEFITLLFRNVFGREPAADGLAAWTQQLDNGRTRADIVAEFSETEEHRIRTRLGQEAFDDTDPTELAGVVFRLFGAVLDRQPAQSGFLAWIENLSSGTTQLEAVTLFMESEEFQIRYGATSNEAFVRLLFNNVLGREPGASGLEAWTARLDAGESRETVVTDFMNEQEFINRTAAELEVFMQGFGADDVLVAYSETAVLSGGLFADSFEFVAPGSDDMPGEVVTSTQVVTDLEAWDWIVLTDFGYASDAEALTHFRQSGADVVFADQGMTVTFLDTQLAMIDSAMIEVVDTTAYA